VFSLSTIGDRMSNSGPSSTPLSGGKSSPSLVVDDSNSVSTADDDSTYVTSRVVYAVILVCGLLVNGALVVYILRRQRRLGGRELPQLNLFVLAIHAAADLVNCSVNAVWMIYAAARGQPSDAYTTLGCRLDAAAVQMVVIVHLVGLALMAVDRLLSVRNAGLTRDQRGLTVRKAALLIVFAWLCSFGLGLPLLIPNGVAVEANSQRYLCTVSSQASPAYVWTTATVGYFCPIGVVTAMFIATAVSTALHRRKLAAMRMYTSSTVGPDTSTGIGVIPGSTADGHREDLASHLAVDVNATKFVACLFAVWSVFVLPFPTLSLVRIGRTAALTSTSRPFTYARAVDAVVTALFVCHPVIVPIVTLIWRKNVCRRCVRRTQTWCRDGSAVVEVRSSGQSPSVTLQSRQRAIPSNTAAPSRPSGPETVDGGSGRPVPVLFATPHGLHVRSSNGQSEPADRQLKSSDNAAESVEEPSRKCDVFGSVCELQNKILLNTSDYDSAEEDGACGDSGWSSCRLDRSLESQGDPPASTSTTDANTSEPDLSTASRTVGQKASCEIEELSASISTWCDDGQSETRLTDSGVGTLKHSSAGEVQAEGRPCPDVPDKSPESTGRATSPGMTEQAQAENVAKPKKKRARNDDGRSCRRVSDVEAGRKGDASDRHQRSAKATSKTSESSQGRRAEPPQHRHLPKIVIKVDELAGVQSNTDPNISTAMTTLDVRSPGDPDIDDPADRSLKTGSGKVPATQTTRRPLPAIGKRRRTASESCPAITNLSDIPKQTGH